MTSARPSEAFKFERSPLNGIFRTSAPLAAAAKALLTSSVPAITATTFVLLFAPAIVPAIRAASTSSK